MILFYLVSERGDLDVKALLLACSMKRFITEQSGYVINILIPSDQEEPYLDLKPYQDLGCRVIHFANNLTKKDTNKPLHGDRVSNKLLFLDNETGENDRMVFLDSDMLFVKNISLDIFRSDSYFCAKQADRANVTQWAKIYDLFGLNLPNLEVKCTVDGIKIPPYFNAGFININSKVRKELFRQWTSYFEKLSEDKIIERNLYNPFNRDQVALALAVQKLNLDVTFLDESYNFPARARLVTNETLIAHYHTPITIYNDDKLRRVFFELEQGNESLRAKVKGCIGWNWIFKSAFTRNVITSSLYSKLLMLLKNHTK